MEKTLKELILSDEQLKEKFAEHREDLLDLESLFRHCVERQCMSMCRTIEEYHGYTYRKKDLILKTLQLLDIKITTHNKSLVRDCFCERGIIKIYLAILDERYK